MKYYVGTMPVNDLYLEHHGIKGQKWGVRRFQNVDGTRTEAGKARYGKYKAHRARDQMYSEYLAQRHANDVAKKFSRKADKQEAKGNTEKAKKLRFKAEAQAASNENFKNYQDSISMGRTWLQYVGLTLTLGNGHWYRKARSRGSSFISAFFQAHDFTGISRAVSNKKKYGKALIWSAMSDDED